MCLCTKRGCGLFNITDGLIYYSLSVSASCFSVRGDVYPHITQIAAKHVNPEKLQLLRVTKTSMSPSAEQRTKIVMKNSTEIYVNGVPVFLLRQNLLN